MPDPSIVATVAHRVSRGVSRAIRDEVAARSAKWKQAGPGTALRSRRPIELDPDRDVVHALATPPMFIWSRGGSRVADRQASPIRLRRRPAPIANAPRHVARSCLTGESRLMRGFGKCTRSIVCVGVATVASIRHGGESSDHRLPWGSALAKPTPLSGDFIQELGGTGERSSGSGIAEPRRMGFCGKRSMGGLRIRGGWSGGESG